MKQPTDENRVRNEWTYWGEGLEAIACDANRDAPALRLFARELLDDVHVDRLDEEDKRRQAAA